MATPRTTVDFRFGSSYVEDDYASGLGAGAAERVVGLLANQQLVQERAAAFAGHLLPELQFHRQRQLRTPASADWWLVHGRSHNPTVNVTHDRGRHHMKVGWQLRYSYDQDNASSGPGSLTFNSVDTGSTFLSSYNATQSGNMYASALLGVLNSGTATIAPEPGHAPAAVGASTSRTTSS